MISIFLIIMISPLLNTGAVHQFPFQCLPGVAQLARIADAYGVDKGAVATP
jgi:hypothetical protein